MMKTFFYKLSVILLTLLAVLTLTCLSVSADEPETQASVTTEASTQASTDANTESEMKPTHVPQCPTCAAITNGGTYCPACGEVLPTVTPEWTCKHVCDEDCEHENMRDDDKPCGQVNDGAYCVACGKPQPEDDSGVKIEFRPAAFVENLSYMAAGMIGIFLVIGVIILTIILLSKLTAPKKKDEDD